MIRNEGRWGQPVMKPFAVCLEDEDNNHRIGVIQRCLSLSLPLYIAPHIATRKHGFFSAHGTHIGTLATHCRVLLS